MSAEAEDAGTQAQARFAWLTLFFASWIIGGLSFLVWALGQGLTHDVGASPYHLPFYLAIVALGVTCLLFVVRARRAGRPWHRALPPGYGGLGVGLLVLLAWPILDVGWREGIGIRGQSLEDFFAPSRLPLVIGTILIAVGPLRAAWRSTAPVGPRWLVVVSAGLVYTLLGAGGFHPAQSPWLESALSGPEDDIEIWVMNGDGSRQTRLIEAVDGYEVASPVWSPDGTQIAYTRVKSPDRFGAFADDQDIWLASADGNDQRPLVAGTGWQWIPHWSPDGAWIVYTVDPPGGPGHGAGFSAPLSGFGQGPAFDQPPSVSPDVDVWRVRADGGGAPERITKAPSDDRAGVYSPDGRHMLFDSTRAEGRTGIYVMDTDGGNVVRATFQGDDWGGSWSPDGTRIAFNSSPTGLAEDIYVTAYPANGAPPTQLTDDSGGDRTPSWSRDGSRIAFASSRDDEQEVWSMAADGSDLQNLTRSAGASENLAPGGDAWGPDGRILFERSGDASARNHALVREDLGAAGMLISAIFLAIVVLVLLVALRAAVPFGAVAFIMALSTAVAAITSGEWRFVPAAVIGGLLVDLLIRLTPRRLQARVAGAGATAALVLGAGATVVVTTGLGWSPTLLLGVAMASAAIGWGLAGVIARPAALATEAAGD